MTAFDRLRKWEFGGLRFPVSDYSVRGAIRDHVHEYPHSAGGAPEKFGRALYVVRATAHFIAPTALTPDQREIYPNLFPETLGKLTALLESQQTRSLTIPTMGTIEAYGLEWDHKKAAKDHSSVTLDLTWREDQDRSNLADVLAVDFGGIAPTLDNLNAVRAEIYAGRPEPSIWSQINALAVQVLGIKDRADLYGSLVAAKIDGLASLLRDADQQVQELNHPDNQDLTEALHQLWSATVDLSRNVTQTRGQVREYTVPMQMTIGDISTAIYGTSSRGVDLLQLNPIEDALAVPAGMTIRYLQAA